MLLGDFNLVRWLVDRSGDYRGMELMTLFKDLTRDLGLVDIQLQNRAYTWCNKQPRPVFSKLDRFFSFGGMDSGLPRYFTAGKGNGGL